MTEVSPKIQNEIFTITESTRVEANDPEEPKNQDLSFFL